MYMLAVLNAPLLTHFSKKFLNNTNYEVSDVRLLPLVVPTEDQEKRLAALASRAVEVQNNILQNSITSRQAELDKIQAQVNAAVEELYGVAGLGPFDEF
jgi:uncharacterized protein YicC (UPF0701 family)